MGLIPRLGKLDTVVGLALDSGDLVGARNERRENERAP
jgi:hypothetical protein